MGKFITPFKLVTYNSLWLNLVMMMCSFSFGEEVLGLGNLVAKLHWQSSQA